MFDPRSIDPSSKGASFRGHSAGSPYSLRGGYFTRQFVVDKRINSVPHTGIVLNLMVRPAQNANQPGIVIAIDVVILISHLDISKDACVIGISRMNCGPP